jgi:hypothetical protein
LRIFSVVPPIFIEGNITNIMESILDLPVSPVDR